MHTLSHIHTMLHILLQNRIKEKTQNTKQTCIRISYIIYNPYITCRTINSSHTHRDTHTHTSFSETEEQKKTCNRKQTSIGISNIIYNPYITGMTINSYRDTPPDTYYSKIKGNKLKNKNKVLQSVRSFTIHI